MMEDGNGVSGGPLLIRCILAPLYECLLVSWLVGRLFGWLVSWLIG